MIRNQFILDLHGELIIDNFAGGGGASTGIEMALGRHVDIAINHDAAAIAMHKANHPQTEHFCESVWDVNPREVTQGRPVGLVWLSPDCKHFSKAKGGKPVEKKIRGLAWIALRWAATVKPRVIMLENVEEFVTWGPLTKEGKPCPKNKGREFRSFKNALERQGFEVQHRELRACDYGAPTIRKRLFLIARSDGQPIVWPEPTHGDPKSEAVKSGRLKPWRTAAECIDWTISCPSIFERKKPLAPATERRVAKGIMRYVVHNPNPFIVTMAHGEGEGKTKRWGAGVRPVDEPLPTVTASGGYGIVNPIIVGAGGPEFSGKPVDIDQPLGTQTTENHRALVAPFITEHANASSQRVNAADEPLRTQCAQVKGGHFSLVAPILVNTANSKTTGRGPNTWTTEEPARTITASQGMAVVAPTLIEIGYGEAPGQAPRAPGLDKPLGTAVAGGIKHALVAGFIAKNYTGVIGSDMEDPLTTVTSVDHNSLVAAHVTKFRSGSVGSAADQPLHTVTAGGDPERDSTGNVHGLVTANLVRQFGNSDAAAADAPVGTIVAGGGGKTLLSTSHIMVNNTGHAGGSMDDPMHTLTTGNHFAEVQAFLIKYYGTDQDPKLEDPLHTITTKDRFGLVTVKGETYQIVDIGLRMLQPRELFRAQGFPDTYIIGDKAEQGLHLTKSDQVRMVGNSVCPPLSCALVAANLSSSMAYLEGKRA